MNCENFDSDNVNNNATNVCPLTDNKPDNNIPENTKNTQNKNPNLELNMLSSKSIEFRKSNDLTLNLRSKTATEIKCLLCSYTDINAAKIEEHINRQHFDLTSPSMCNEVNESTNFVCPFCPKAFESTNYLESHVNVNHRDILSPLKENKSYKKSPIILNRCPVCDLFTSTSTKELTEHVELHFSTSLTSPDISNDCFIAKELLKEDEEKFKLEQQREFEFLQAQYGMDNEGNFREQSIKNMQKAVYSGELTVSDFYEKQIELKMAETCGVDDGTSCLSGIIPGIREKSKTSTNVAQTYLCSDLDFYAASYGDRGWGCGYRNLQMMLSSLFRCKRYDDLLSKQLTSKFDIEKSPSGSLMPSISKLQQIIEWAWNEGFDEQGREQLGSKLHNTRKWIGATEIITLLSSLRFRCQCIDIHRPSPDGSHPKMFDWILRYFQKPEPFKPPLYLQHQGHSRTVIGVEVLKDGELFLLILDPGISIHQMEKSVSNWNPLYSLKFLRKSLYNLKSDQFQIATVIGIVNSEQEYQANKVLRSTKIF